MKREEVGDARFIVLGAARSGIAAARLLKKHGADVVVGDSKSREQGEETRRELEKNGIESVWGDEAIFSAMDGRHIMIKSPGIPQENSIVMAARKSGLRVISEIELASAFVSDGARVVAVTGTNGKTTTTAWLTHVLNVCEYNAIAAGNIGDAWSARIENADGLEKSVFVVEASSFQLEDLEDFRPDVAILTNITPDHMDRYDDRLEHYMAAKANVLLNMGAEQIFVWNATDANSRQVAEKSRATNLAFNAVDGTVVDLAAWVRDGELTARRAGQIETVMSIKELPLPGTHNLENALAVTLAALSLGTQPESIAEGLKTFPGVEHRIELCHTRADGVRFYNDSKATNLDAMEKALMAFDAPIVLIAGGRDAHSDYASITALVKEHVVQLITLGEAAPLIEKIWGDLVPTQRAETMTEAVALANEVAIPGSVVLFSPACKSFDMYKNFEERGRDFKAAVAGL